MVFPIDMTIHDDKLDELDTVLKLVQGLTSKDNVDVDDAVIKADDFLKKKNSASTGQQQPKQHDASKNAFMRAVEQDAAERSQRRAQQRARAEKLKERANAYFKTGDWRRAVELYTQAIEALKSWEVLYTNRALAYLRSGEPCAALKDCDTALDLLNFNQPETESSEISQPCVQRAKTHFHRGKALLALGRPDEALAAYTEARTFTPPTTAKGKKPEWPAYLVDYVAQAETAIAAKLADAKAEAEFANRAINQSQKTEGNSIPSEATIPTSTQLVCLLAQLARADQDLTYYSAGLRQLTRLLATAPRQLTPMSDSTAATTSPTPTVAGDTTTNTSGAQRRNRGRKKKKTKPTSPTPAPMNGLEGEENSCSVETFADLQALFRVKNGFTLLGKEIKAVYQSLESPVLSSETTASSTKQPQESNQTNGHTAVTAPRIAPQNELPSDCADRLLALLNLTTLLTTECGENQRILVEQQPKFVDAVLHCVRLTPMFVDRITVGSEPTRTTVATGAHGDRGPTSNNSQLYQKRHKFGALRDAALDLLLSLTAQPSGRQALLTAVGPAALLDAMALCLADSLGQAPPQTSLTANSALSKSAGGPSTASTAVGAMCAAKAAQVLENLTESPGFLLSARSSVASLDSLLSVVEAALSVSTTARTTGGAITTTARCLATLLDALSAACQDGQLRTGLMQRRQPLLMALAECLLWHAPLFEDPGVSLLAPFLTLSSISPSHALLVSSTTRLLHNMCVGQLNQTGSSSNSLASQLASVSRLADTLLAGVGAVLDQPGHGPELRAVATALAGRLLPLCSAKQVLKWLGETTDEVVMKTGPVMPIVAELTERGRLLLAILDHCSLPSTTNRANTVNGNDGARADSVDATSPEPTEGYNHLSGHLLGGCVRSLAAGTMHSVSMRYAIGDNRRRVRRLARLMRAKQLPPAANSHGVTESDVGSSSGKKRGGPSGQKMPRDEPLAGNACLVLQHCSDDTPLAEHLQDTSVILDLLQLIQESEQLDTKRNAAILIGKLAQASHSHRDELSRLDGWSVLTPFNSWTASLTRGM